LIDNESLEQDEFIEKIRNLPEYVIFGEKYNKPEYFDAIKDKQILDEILYSFKKDDVKINVQIMQTINILIQNIRDQDRLSKFTWPVFIVFRLYL
jgi:bifunctional pyridoxal-dependent enzyme with beta-cystathionase and maltose regulon repressor activities